MKHLVLIAFFLVLTSLSSRAQVNYKKGLVVTSQGDTLRGYIDYKEWIKNPKSISFVSSLETKNNQEFTPDNSSYFEIENLETYQTFQGRISADKTGFNNIKEIPIALDTTTIYEKVFLKILQKGQNVTLFVLSDEVKFRYFVKESNENKIQELGFRKYIDPVKKDQIRLSRPYLGQLWILAEKYNVSTPALKRSLELSDYKATDLINVISAINKVNTRQIRSKTTAENFRLFAGAGINHSATQMIGDHFLAHSEATYKTSVYPKLIVGSDWFLNPNVKRLIFRGEVSFTKTDQKIYRKYDDEAATFEFKQNIISVFPQILYNLYNNERIKLFVSTGLSASIVSYPVNRYQYELTYYTGSTYRKGADNFYKVENFWYLVPVKAGFALRNLEFSAIYYAPYAVTKYHNFTLVTKSVHMQVNYLFNK